MSNKSSQSGLTLVEVIIASALTALLVGGFGMAIYAIVSVTQRGNDEASALHDIQNASYWISNDTQMASTTDLVDEAGAVDSVTLEWIDGQGNPHSSIYSLLDTELERDYDGSIRTVARYVSSIEFSLSGNLITFRLESTPPGRWQVSREATGTVYLRPNA